MVGGSEGFGGRLGGLGGLEGERVGRGPIGSAGTG